MKLLFGRSEFSPVQQPMRRGRAASAGRIGFVRAARMPDGDKIIVAGCRSAGSLASSIMFIKLSQLEKKIQDKSKPYSPPSHAWIVGSFMFYLFCEGIAASRAR
jgi:hypothetical protein